MLRAVQLPAEEAKGAGTWIRTRFTLPQKLGLQVTFVPTVSIVLHLTYEPACKSPHPLG